MEQPLIAAAASAVRQASGLEFFLLSAASLALTLTGILSAFRYFNRARVLENVPTSRIRSATQGYIELQGNGELMDGAQIRAPLTGHPCTWWSYRVEHRAASEHLRRGRSRWQTIEQGTSDAIFRLSDATGRCVVDPAGAIVYPAVSRVWYGNTPRPSSGPSPKLGGLWGRYRYTEKRMRPNDPLYAIGFFRTHAAAEAHGMDEDVRNLLAEWKRDTAGLLRRFDADGNGTIDLEEWEAARAEAIAEVRRAHHEAASGPGLHVLSAPPDKRPFLLAAMPQERLARRLRRLAGTAITAFVLGCGLSASLLWLRMN